MNPELADLKPGDSVVVGRGERQGERYPTFIRKVAKLTGKQIVLDNNDRYKRDSGLRIGPLGGYILRKATADDLAREEEKKRKLEESRQKSQEIAEHREGLSKVFPETFRPSISVGKNEDDFELTFYGLSETQVRKFAELLKNFKS